MPQPSTRPVTGRPRIAGTLDRYVIRRFTGPFLYALGALASLLVMVDIFERIDWILGNAKDIDATAWQIVVGLAQFYAVRLTLLLLELGPALPLIAALVAASEMLRRRELVAMKAAGVSSQRVYAPLVAAAALLGLFAFGVRGLLGAEMVRFAADEKSRLLGRKLKPSASLSVQGNTASGQPLTLNVEDLDLATGEARGFTVVIWPAGGEPIHIWASEARYEADRWVLTGGARFVYADQGTEIGRPASELVTALSPRVLAMERYGVDGLGFNELIAGRGTTVAATELHKRLASPLGWVALVLLGMPLIVRDGDKSPLKGIALALVIVAIYGAISLTGISLAGSGRLPPWLGAWGPQVAALTIGMIAYRRMET